MGLLVNLIQLHSYLLLVIKKRDFFFIEREAYIYALLRQEMRQSEEKHG